MFGKEKHYASGNSMSFVQDENQEITPDIIKEVKLRSTYRYFRVFRTKEMIFDYPAILDISLKANKAPVDQGSIKLNFRYKTSMVEAHGPGPFKEEIRILKLKPYESRRIEVKTRVINYIPRIQNPASLELEVLNSKGQQTGFKTLYIDLKSVEEAKKEIRNKIVFWAVILTLVLSLASFFKDCLFPLTRDLSTVVSEAPSGKQSPGLVPAGENASSALPNRNGFEKVVGSKGESSIPDTKLRQPIAKKAEQGPAH